MNEGAQRQQDRGEQKRSFGCLQLLGVALACALAAALLTAWWVKRNVYASYHTPTELSAPEENALATKLDRLRQVRTPAAREPASVPAKGAETAVAEPYSEEGARREISLTERELNSLIAKDAEMARKVAVDLAADLVSLNIVAPVEEGVPLFGGKTLRFKAGVSLAYEAGRPEVILRGVSLGGIPIPNAWLGNLKNRNLVEEFGSQGGFWELFADGVEDMKVREGHLLIKLRE